MRPVMGRNRLRCVLKQIHQDTRDGGFVAGDQVLILRAFDDEENFLGVNLLLDQIDRHIDRARRFAFAMHQRVDFRKRAPTVPPALAGS